METENHLLKQAMMISPLAARQYAEAKGWKLVSQGIEGRLYLLQHPDHQLRQLIIPMDGGDADYGTSLLDAASRLVEIEQRNLESILADLLLPDADVLRFRVVSEDADSGFLSLEGGINLLEGAKRALLSSACSVEHRKKHHPRMTFEEATQLVSSSRLGQTEHGSYVVKIACPLSAIDEGWSPGARLPFVRKATSLLMQSSHLLVSAIEKDEIETLYQEPDDNSMLSSNFCDALLRMQAVDEQASLTIKAQWASLLPVHPSDPTPPEVTFNRDYFPVIEKLRDRLRSPTNPGKATFIGTVERLGGQLGLDNRRSGEVTLSVLYEGEMVPARVSLGAESYAIADKAHMSGDFITIEGVLHLGKRIHKILEAQNFKILES